MHDIFCIAFLLLVYPVFLTVAFLFCETEWDYWEYEAKCAEEWLNND